MDYAPVVNDTCYAYEDESLDISCVEPTRYDQFFIKIEVEFRKLPEQDQDNDEPDFSRLEITRKTEIFLERCNRMPYNNLSLHSVTRMLDIMGVQVYDHEYMFYRMLLCADKIVNEPHNRNKKILPMKVFITIAVNYSLEEPDDSFVLIHTNTVQFKAIPAGNKYVEGLEKVRIEETELGRECVICMEKMEVGSEARKMPCSHVYHGNCLMNWLVVKRVCPLCRFVLPSRMRIQNLE
ncbi:E3 ubiquitin-protein ligase CIP8-like [Nicotiana tomentosiformis]|uniref:E3 ubiquitin-protein ligase CIP8-like n=1 Tax=Nicotiana tomentosiformis TaxID=4098 RepID=UPI00051AB958|nr:E3 ubiquitin-protein ligase CIP8-like [Nicotiana tomentosiformis]